MAENNDALPDFGEFRADARHHLQGSSAYPTVWSLTPSYDAYEVGVFPFLERQASDGKVTFKSKSSR